MSTYSDPMYRIRGTFIDLILSSKKPGSAKRRSASAPLNRDVDPPDNRYLTELFAGAQLLTSTDIPRFDIEYPSAASYGGAENQQYGVPSISVSTEDEEVDIDLCSNATWDDSEGDDALRSK